MLPQVARDSARIRRLLAELLHSLAELGPNVAKSKKFDQRWPMVAEFGPIWADLGRFGATLGQLLANLGEC